MNKSIHLTDNSIRITGVRAGMYIQSQSAVLKMHGLTDWIDQYSQQLLSWEIYIELNSALFQYTIGAWSVYEPT